MNQCVISQITLDRGIGCGRIGVSEKQRDEGIEVEYDYTERLGFAKMPPGYKLIGLDSGHFIWTKDEEDLESCIHWNRWAIYKGAWAHHKGEATK